MLHLQWQGCYNIGWLDFRETPVLKSFTVLIGLVALTIATAASAEVVEGLYAATVPVADRGDAAMANAAGDALAEVVVKVSGSAEAVAHPSVVKALPKARGNVQQYAFVRDQGSGAGLSARFEFEASYVNNLLSQSGLPLWTANRPRVLVWMAVDVDGERQLVSSLDTPDLAAQLLREFERRGVPARLPLFDLSDATAISVDDVWGQRVATIVAASARYGVEDVLVGRAVTVSSGKWTGNWSYLSGQQHLDRAGNAPAMEGFLQVGVNMVAEEMASRYAVAPGGTQDRLRMVVSGVYAFADYAAIVNWLESLELIQNANIEHIGGDRIELDLDAEADAAQLARIIELNKRLQPVPGPAADLVYQWTK